MSSGVQTRHGSHSNQFVGFQPVLIFGDERMDASEIPMDQVIKSAITQTPLKIGGIRHSAESFLSSQFDI